jgi:hypothetical protein
MTADRFEHLDLTLSERKAAHARSLQLCKLCFNEANAFSIVPSTEKCSALKSRFTRRSDRSAARNPCAMSHRPESGFAEDRLRGIAETRAVVLSGK